MRSALESLPGVAKVETDLSSDPPSATITVEKGKFDAAKAAEALAKEGFEGSKVLKAAGSDPEGS